jgi:hypothetical protein
MTARLDIAAAIQRRLPELERRVAAFSTIFTERAYADARACEDEAYGINKQSYDLFEATLINIDECADALIDAIYATKVRRCFDRANEAHSIVAKRFPRLYGFGAVRFAADTHEVLGEQYSDAVLRIFERVHKRECARTRNNNQRQIDQTKKANTRRVRDDKLGVVYGYRRKPRAR